MPTSAYLPTDYDDFTAFTELDPDSVVAVSASLVDIDGLPKDEDARVYDDRGTGELLTVGETHRLEPTLHSADQYGEAAVWACSNVLDDGYYWSQNSSEAIELRFYYDGTDYKLRLKDWETGNEHSWASVSTGTTYYVTLNRTSETNVTAEIRTGSHSGTLQTTLNVTVASSRRYRYLFALNSVNSGGSPTITCNIENLHSSFSCEGESASALDQNDQSSLSASEDLDIATSDDTRHDHTVSGSSSLNACVRTEFIIAEDVGDITQLDITSEGWGVAQTGAPGYTYDYCLYIWNVNTTTWEALDSHTNSSDQTLTGQITSNVSNYIGPGGQVNIRSHSAASVAPYNNATVHVDLHKLVVTYAGLANAKCPGIIIAGA